jgi:hypothetical protein
MDQLRATFAAARALVDAHVELAKAEFAEIADEVKRVAALSGLAIGAAIFAGLLLAIGLPLFLGELIFGSIGWGLLHGVLVLVGIAVAAGIMAAGIEQTRVALALLTGFAAGLAVAIILGSGLSNLVWTLAGDNLLPLAADDVRPLAAALVILPAALGLLLGVLDLISTVVGDDKPAPTQPPTVGERMTVAAPAALYVGWLSAFGVAYSQQIAWFDWRLLGVLVAGAAVVEILAMIIGHWRSGFALLTGLSIGAGLGIVLAVFTAIDFGWRVGIAIGLTVALGTWIGMMALEATHIEFDEETLKKRFYPKRTVDMAKETLEWAKARNPLSRGS